MTTPLPPSDALLAATLFGQVAPAVGLLVTDVEGLILYASPAMGQMLAAPQLTGRHILDYVAPRARRDLWRLLRAALTFPLCVPLQAQREDGEAFWCEIRVMPANPEMRPGAHYLTLVQPLTERQTRHAEHQELRRALSQTRQLRQITAQLPSMTWTTDPELRLTSASGTALANFGLEPSQYVGRSVAELLGGLPSLPHALHAHQGALLGLDGSYTHVLEDRVFDVQVRPFRDDTGRVIGALALAVDATERRRSQWLDQDRAAVLEGIALSRPLERTLHDITALLERQYPGALVQILVRQGDRLLLGAAHNLPGDLVTLLSEGVPVSVNHGGCGAAAATGLPQFTSSIEDTPSWRPYWKPARRHGLKACWTVPVRSSAGQVLGTLALYARAGDPALPDTLDLLERTANLAAIALEREIHLRTIALNREETLRAMGLALEYRDYETRGHTDRVVRLSEKLARSLGLQGPALDAVRWGAYLHDLGKLAIPDAVLLKPGRPTEEEWETIRRHPQLGYELLAHIPALPQATLDVVLSHHEWWDGTGYPRGLSGEAIPYGARLFSVVDVYDALTSARPYKAAWTHQAALAELRRLSGQAFDPALVAAFEAVSGGVPPDA